MFFANTGDDLFYELSRRINADKGHVSAPATTRISSHSGKQAGGGYDPVCFAMGRRAHGDAPVIRLDHEDVLTSQSDSSRGRDSAII